MDQNACKNPNVQQQQQKQKNHEGAMDKLREAMLKLSNSAPNGPLSTTQNSFLQQRLTNFLSCLHTTPDHPPYAWMIEKALKELDEKGGSSEDSISKFIKKEYDSLPWAHMTLLKHHLQKMSDKGEILMIDGGWFLLPDDSESSSPKRKKKRKYVKRKRSGNSEIKRRRPRQKEKEEEKCVLHDDVELVGEQKKLDEQQNDVTVKRKRRGNSEIKQKKPRQKEEEEETRVQQDDVEVVGEQKKLDEQQNEVTVSGNHGKENRIREECWELNEHQNEPSTDKEDGQLSGQQNYVTGNKVNDKPDISFLQNPTGFEAVSIEKSSQTDRSQRQLKRWNKSPGDSPKPVSTSEVEPLPPLALATREEALNLTDPQHEVHLEQPKQQHRGSLLKKKEDEAKKDKSTISTLATNEEVVCMDEPEDEVHLKQQKEKRRGRALRGKEDGADPDTTLLKNLVLSEKLTKKQNGGGLGRRRKAQ